MDTILTIRPYRTEDRSRLIECMETFQDYLVGLDSFKLMHRLPEYGEGYTNWLLTRIDEQHGQIFFAETDGRVVGLVAGVIEEQGEKQKLEDIPYLEGHVLDLFVEASSRGQGIGTKLMRHLEEYFRSRNCTVLSIGVMSDNPLAHKLYQKLGYRDRDVYMVKRV